ncbi:uncharacterized protein [Dysidea avara]|uniref:uncharacterized protein isoform X2 n=2 Tax=Dysidea avara TaxID=196820 RepID=UPI00331F88DD
MMGNEFAGAINKVSIAHKWCIQTLFHQLADEARMPILADPEANDGGLEKWEKTLNELTNFKNKRARHFDVHRSSTRTKYCIQDKLVKENTVLKLDLSVAVLGLCHYQMICQDNLGSSQPLQASQDIILRHHAATKDKMASRCARNLSVYG